MLVNVAVWHKTDRKDKLHPNCVFKSYSVYVRGGACVCVCVCRGGEGALFFVFFFNICWMCVCWGTSSPQKHGEVGGVVCSRATGSALTASF